MQPLCGRSGVSSHEDKEDFGQGEKQGDPEQPLPDLFHRTQLTLPQERLAAFEVGLHPHEFIVTHQSNLCISLGIHRVTLTPLISISS